MQRQILSHNLANVSTTGFRAQMMAFRAAPVRGDGATTRVFQQETTLGYDDTRGPSTSTGRNLDVAMKGRAWMSVQETLDGSGPTPVPVNWSRRRAAGHQPRAAGAVRWPHPGACQRRVLVAGDGTVYGCLPGWARSVRSRWDASSWSRPSSRWCAAGMACSAPRPATRSARTPMPRLQGLPGPTSTHQGQRSRCWQPSAQQCETQAKLLSTAQSRAASRLLSGNADGPGAAPQTERRPGPHRNEGVIMIRSSGSPRPAWKPQQMQLDVVSSNLANVSTNGWRSRAQFEDLMYQNLPPVGANNTDQTVLPTGLQVGLGCARCRRRQLHAGVLASRRQPAGPGHQGPGLLPGPAARWHHGLATRDGSFPR